jgi:hypothetical protein
MTEQEWLECTDPLRMLRFIWGKASDRKYRLFTCACCRRIWGLLSDERSRAAVECAERHVADKYASGEELAVADDGANEARCAFAGYARDAADAALCATNFCEDEEADAAIAATELSARAASGGRLTIRDEESTAQSNLVLCIFGNPFRPITLNCDWLTPTVQALAQAAHDNRNLPSGTLDHHRLAVLAAALEDAGCDNADILDHCRQPGEHVRGCWPLDLILGKK